jgi:hypothetical protein
MEGALLISWIIITSCTYIPLGILLLLRSKRKAIRNRSPLLVVIAHWSNYFECCLLLVSLYMYFTKSLKNDYFDLFYQFIVIIVHYSYFIAYMLRCYRVHFIFNLDYRWDDEDGYFKRNLHRAGQKWLVKIFLMFLWPVVIIGTLRIAISGADEYFPPSYYEGEDQVTAVSEGIYLFFMFLEELAFIISVYKLRNVQDDFKMSVELTVVCVLWVLTGFFSIFTETWVWRVEVVVRNHIIMIISTLYPLIKTMKLESFDEIITLEMLQSLELVLQSTITLNAFENTLRAYGAADRAPEILQLWLKCEYFRYCKSQEVEKEIIEASRNLQLRAKQPFTIQSEVFQILNTKYFPVFKNSEEYKELLRDITRQQIYLHRIMQTSLGGEGTEIHISNII